VHTCREFLDRWNMISFRDPQAGRRHADRGLEMVRQLGSPPELLARGLTILGSSYRATGDLPRADHAYAAALRIYHGLDVSDRRGIALDEADLHRRRAILRMEEHRYAEGLDAADRAITIYKAGQDRHELGRSYSAKGLLEYKMGYRASIGTISHALTLMDASRNPDAHDAASHNLQLALADFKPEAATLERSLEQLHAARVSRRSLRPSRRQGHRRQLMARRRRTLADAKTRYLQGRILVMLGRHDEARPLLETAHEDLLALHAPLDAAATALPASASFGQQCSQVVVLVGRPSSDRKHGNHLVFLLQQINNAPGVHANSPQLRGRFRIEPGFFIVDQLAVARSRIAL
jgi:tetratricopeptide (TPR) repeat protein